jgi:hypothetical protein
LLTEHGIHDLLHLGNGRAGHGSRDIEHEHHVDRQVCFVGRVDQAGVDVHREVSPRAVVIAQHTDIASRVFPAEPDHDVLVRDCLVPDQAHERRVGAGRQSLTRREHAEPLKRGLNVAGRDVDVMACAHEIVDCIGCEDQDCEIERAPATRVGRKIARVGASLGKRCRIEARADDRGKRQLVGAHVVRDRHTERDRHFDTVVGKDIAQFLHEYVVLALHEKRGLLALLLRLFVLLLGLLFFEKVGVVHAG